MELFTVEGKSVVRRLITSIMTMALIPLTVAAFSSDRDMYFPQTDISVNRSWLRLMEM